tara:strand:+ start:1264 stop:1584 length:321 start_codon:yes stop_codon:yes gene_type:complete
MSQSDTIIYPATEWNANDYANIITISAAAISSVLLVIFKSRCKTIDICWGAINCLRDPMEEEDANNENNNNDNNNNENNNNNDEEQQLNQNNNPNNNPNNNNNDEG